MAEGGQLPLSACHRVLIPGVSLFSVIVISAEEWLEDQALNGVYNRVNHFEDGRRVGIAFWFSDADTAFAFKVRWG